MAIELVRISELCMVILSALSFANGFASLAASASVTLICGCFSLPKLLDRFCGEFDEVEDTIRMPPDEMRIPCDGDMDKFCGEPIGGKLLAADVVDGRADGN